MEEPLGLCCRLKLLLLTRVRLAKDYPVLWMEDGSCIIRHKCKIIKNLKEKFFAE